MNDRNEGSSRIFNCFSRHGFRAEAEHVPTETVSAVERGTDAMLRQIATIGPQTQQWAEATTQARGVEAVRVLVGLKALAGKHSTEALEQICQTAQRHEDQQRAEGVTHAKSSVSVRRET